MPSLNSASQIQAIKTLFNQLWQDYQTRLCPMATKVHQVLALKEGKQALQNDHIALRTFASKKLGLKQLAQHFEHLGYVKAGEYEFKAKKLYAHHYQHSDLSIPKVFISELLVDELSDTAQQVIYQLIAQVSDGYAQDESFLYQGRPWQLTQQDYDLLAIESEYAAWVAAHGFGANHFTVYVNALKHFEEVASVNQFLTEHGFVLNKVGGEVKGSEFDKLEQSATMADKVWVEFNDEKKVQIPGGFYEFAKRYPEKPGADIDLNDLIFSDKLYQGFVAASADKIFESTHQQR